MVGALGVTGGGGAKAGTKNKTRTYIAKSMIVNLKIVKVFVEDDVKSTKVRVGVLQCETSSAMFSKIGGVGRLCDNC